MQNLVTKEELQSELGQLRMDLASRGLLGALRSDLPGGNEDGRLKSCPAALEDARRRGVSDAGGNITTPGDS